MRSSTPLRLDEGGVVFVNRGFVPAEKQGPVVAAAGQVAGEVTVTGLMRRPKAAISSPRPTSPTTISGSPATRRLIAAHWGFADAAPFSVDADSTPNPGGWPKGGATVMTIPNNHLSYALTWFALAATLAAVAGAFVWRREEHRRT